MKNSGKVFYEIQYSTKKNFKKATKTLKVSAKKTKVIIKNLEETKILCTHKSLSDEK